MFLLLLLATWESTWTDLIKNNPKLRRSRGKGEIGETFRADTPFSPDLKNILKIGNGE